MPRRSLISAQKRPPTRKVSPDLANISEFVRAHRRSAKLTQRQLSELAGVGPRAVWDLEQGKRTLRMDVVNAVLAVFGKRLGIVELPRELLLEEPD